MFENYTRFWERAPLEIVILFQVRYHFYFPTQRVGTFDPQRPSRQAVVTGAFSPPPPGCRRSSLSLKGFIIPTARRLATNCVNSRSSTFGDGRELRRNSMRKYVWASRGSNPGATASEGASPPPTHNQTYGHTYIV